MSSTDTRIVVLEFDNDSFEQGVKQTLQTLKNLEQSINDTEESSKSLDNLTKAASNVNLSHIEVEADKASEAFTALQAVAFGALTSIGEKAVEVGSQLVKNLGINQAMEGWRKYASETGAVQMMVNAGYELEEVENVLAKLMTYADETSYSYDAMVDSLSKFTTYGLDLNQSASALEGFNSLAALMGVNAENAQHALTGLTGAMAQGYMANNNFKWFNTARMTGVALKEAFIEAGEAVGMLIRDEDGVLVDINKGLEVTAETFQSTLSSKWLTNDVMITAFNNYGKYADDIMNMETAFGLMFNEAVEVATYMQEMNPEDDWGWTEAAKTALAAAQAAKTLDEAVAATYDAASSRWKAIWKLIFGNYEEAKVLFTDLANWLYDVTVEPLWDLSEALEGWRLLGGRETLFGNGKDGEALGAFYNMTESISIMLGTIRDALGDIFTILDFGDSEESGLMKHADKIYQYVRDRADAIREAGGEVTDYMPLLYEAGEAVLGNADEANYQAYKLFDLTLKLQDATRKVREFLESHTEEIKSIIYALIAPVSIIFNLLKGLGQVIKAVLDSTLFAVLKGVFSVILNISEHFGNFAKRINDAIKGFTGFSDAAEAVSEKLAPVKEFIEKLFDAINNGIDKFADWTNGIVDSYKEFKSLNDIVGKKSGLLDFVQFKFDSKGGGWTKLAVAIGIVKDKARTASDGVKSFTEAFKDAVKNGDESTSFLERLQTNLSEQEPGWTRLTALIDKFRRILDKVSPVLSKFKDDIKQTFINLKDAIKKTFSKSETEGVETFGDKFRSAFDKIKTSVGNAGIGEKLSNVFGKIGEALKKIDWTSVLDRIGNAFESFGNVLSVVWGWIKTGWDYIKPVLQEIGDHLKDFWDTYMGGESLSTTALHGGLLYLIIEFVKKVKDFQSPIKQLGDIKDHVVGILDSIRNVFVSYQKDINANILKKIALSIIGIAIAVLLLSKIDADGVDQAVALLAMIFTGISSLFWVINKNKKVVQQAPQQVDVLTNSLGGFISSLSGAVSNFIYQFTKNLQFNMIAMALIEFAIAVGIIAGAIAKLAKLDADKLLPAAEIIGGVMVAMAGLLVGIFALSKKSGDIGSAMTLGSNMNSISKLLIAFSASIYIIAKALGNLAGLDQSSVDSAFWYITGLVGELAIILQILSNIKPATMEEAKATLISFSASLLILAIATSIIAGIDTKDLIKAGIALGAFAGLIVGFSYALKSGSFDPKIGLTLLAIAGSMAVLTGVLIAMKLVSWEDLGKAGVALVVFLGAIAGFSRAVDPSTMLKSIGPLFAIAGALAALVPVLLAMKLISWDELGMAGAALGALLLAFLAVGFALDKLNISTDNLLRFSAAIMLVGAGVLGVGAGLYLFSLSIDRLYESAEKIPQIFTKIAVGLADNIETITQSAITIGTAIIDALIMSFANNVTNMATQLVGFVSTVLDMFIQNGGPIVDKLLDCILIILDKLQPRIPEIAAKLFDIIGSIISELGKAISNVGVKNLAIVGGVFVALTGILYFLGKNKTTIVKSLPALGIMLIAVAAIGTLLVAMSLFDADKILKIALGLSATMLAFSAMTFVLVAIGQLGGGAIKAALMGVAALAIVIGGVTTIVGSLAALMAFIEDKFGVSSEDIIAKINSVGDVLEAIGMAIGKFIGGTVAGMIDSFLPTLEQLGTSLSNFMTNLQPFINGAKQMDGSTLEAVGILIGVIMALCAAEVVDALINNPITKALGFETSFTQIGGQLVGFAKCMTDFAAEVSKLDESELNKTLIAARAAQALGEFMNAIPRSGGILQDIIGSKDMDKATRSIITYISAMVAIAPLTKTFTEELVERFAMARDIGLAMNELAETIPRTGGIWQDIIGEADLGDFGKKVAAYVAAISLVEPLASKLEESDTGHFEIARDIGITMNDLADVIPKVGGIVQDILGEQNLADFGAKVAAYIDAITMAILVLRSSSFTNDDKDRIVMAAEAGQAMADLAEAAPKTGGIWEKITGSNNIADFGKKMLTFANPIVAIASELTGFSQTSKNHIVYAADAGLELTAFAEACAEIKNSNGIKNLGDGIENFGSQLKSYADDIKGIDFSTLNSSTSILVTFTTAISDLSSNGISEFEQAFTNAKTTTAKVIAGWIEAALNAIEGKISDFKGQGTACANAFKNGLGSQKDAIRNTASSMVSSAISALSSAATQASTLGSNWAQGYANGISSKITTVASAAKTIANTTNDVTRRDLLISSPSRVAYRLGAFYTEGYANGILSQADLAEKNTSIMVKGTIGTMQYAMNRISDVLANGDLAPTITPVLDLTDVQNGVGYLNGAFGSRSINVGTVSGRLGSNIGVVSPRANIIANAYDDNNVVSAINNLNERIDSLGSDIQGMQVVMNTGALVGEISTPMNRALGRISVKQNRGG